MLWRLSKNTFSYEIVVLLLFIICYIICRTFNITCLIYEFTRIPCPTCYMGRALISFLKGDFEQYIMYNAMAAPVAVALLLELSNVYFNKIKRFIHIYAISILVINMFYYFIRFNFLF